MKFKGKFKMIIPIILNFLSLDFFHLEVKMARIKNSFFTFFFINLYWYPGTQFSMKTLESSCSNDFVHFPSITCRRSLQFEQTHFVKSFSKLQIIWLNYRTSNEYYIIIVGISISLPLYKEKSKKT